MKTDLFNVKTVDGATFPPKIERYVERKATDEECLSVYGERRTEKIFHRAFITSILSYVSFMLSALCVYFGFMAIGGENIVGAVAWFSGAVLLVVVAIFLRVISGKDGNIIKGSVEEEFSFDAAFYGLAKILGVPENALPLYLIDGEEVYKKNRKISQKHYMGDCLCFAVDGNFKLYMADKVYAIPLKDMGEMKRIDERLTVYPAIMRSLSTDDAEKFESPDYFLPDKANEKTLKYYYELEIGDSEVIKIAPFEAAKLKRLLDPI
ncbi:MAG: hypothetical protein IJ706_10895 [Clostridia bacterium]|nr:hypothetical protein [Clostridia bacterium]